jgi:hypothetical protein
MLPTSVLKFNLAKAHNTKANGQTDRSFLHMVVVMPDLSIAGKNLLLKS